jgi:hypothetical protein
VKPLTSVFTAFCFLAISSSVSAESMLPAQSLFPPSPLEETPLFQQKFSARLADEEPDEADASIDLREDNGFVHQRIAWMRSERHEPTERGLWFTRGRPEDTLGRLASDAQYPTILAQGYSLMQQGEEGERMARQGFGAVIATGMATVLVKKTWRRRRPYPNDHKFGTFPSGHTSTVFAMAAVYASAQPEQKWLALGSASLVGWSRVKVRAHHWHDVLAGAALGYTIGKQFAPDKPLQSRRNVPLVTWQMAF